MTTPDIPQSPEPEHVCCAGGDPECEGCLLCEGSHDVVSHKESKVSHNGRCLQCVSHKPRCHPNTRKAAPSHPCVYRQEVA